MSLNACFRHAGLLRADLLHVEAEDAGPFRQVVDVASGLEQLEHVAVLHGLPLLVGELELVADTHPRRGGIPARLAAELNE